MKRIIFTMTVLLGLSIWAGNVFAEIQLTNAQAKDIGRAYGFYLGQDYSLNLKEIPLLIWFGAHS